MEVRGRQACQCCKAPRGQLWEWWLHFHHSASPRHRFSCGLPFQCEGIKRNRDQPAPGFSIKENDYCTQTSTSILAPLVSQTAQGDGRRRALPQIHAQVVDKLPTVALWQVVLSEDELWVKKINIQLETQMHKMQFTSHLLLRFVIWSITSVIWACKCWLSPLPSVWTRLKY